MQNCSAYSKMALVDDHLPGFCGRLFYVQLDIYGIWHLVFRKLQNSNTLDSFWPFWMSRNISAFTVVVHRAGHLTVRGSLHSAPTIDTSTGKRFHVNAMKLFLQRINRRLNNAMHEYGQCDAGVAGEQWWNFLNPYGSSSAKYSADGHDESISLSNHGAT